ncbi:MAG: hypothetical protein R3190_12915 [Thermoanaerobaculia bacterium]|nr:hypothetical protein [Thermoanaerobaculia bacterium]
MKDRGAAAAVLAAALAAAPAVAETELGADLRYYQFFIVEDIDIDRRHAEIAVLRGKLESEIAEALQLEAHAVLAFNSPPRISNSADILSGGTRRLLDLSVTLVDDDNVLGIAELDRLNLKWEHTDFDLVAGRQAVTWGVNYFWPVLDLFAPFAPEQIDRDYKAGVDAIRTVVPTGSFSEVEVIVAGQGEELPEELSYASLGRLHSGTTDFGFMAGSFHEDIVAGAFFSADVSGVGIRGELAYTDSGDPADAEIDRETFARATFGVMRLLTPESTLVAEVSWNGFGADDPEGYARTAASDRVRRGEVSSLGRLYGGVSFGWQLSPLWTLSEAVLVNLDDDSVLLQSFADWSVTSALTVQLGASVGFGDDLGPEGQIRSEYGAVPVNVWAAVKAFF